jgi:hypothetical protein
MGGIGSGRWHYGFGKDAVEDGLSFSIYDVIGKKGFYSRSISLHWSRNGNPTSSMAVEIFRSEDQGFIELKYVMQGESVCERIPVIATRQPFGNLRYWMLCPILRHGEPCSRRCYKLYSGPGQKYFGCRKCMNLTYQSSKDSHKYDRLYSMIADQSKMPVWFVKRAMKHPKS